MRKGVSDLLIILIGLGLLASSRVLFAVEKCSWAEQRCVDYDSRRREECNEFGEWVLYGYCDPGYHCIDTGTYTACEQDIGTTIPTTTLRECQEGEERCVSWDERRREKCVGGIWQFDSYCAEDYRCIDTGFYTACEYKLPPEEIPNCLDEGGYEHCSGGDLYNTMCVGSTLYICEDYRLGEPSYSYCWNRVRECTEGCVEDEAGAYCKEDFKEKPTGDIKWSCYAIRDYSTCVADPKCDWFGLSLFGYCYPKVEVAEGVPTDGVPTDAIKHERKNVMDFEDCETVYWAVCQSTCEFLKGATGFIPIVGQTVKKACRTYCYNPYYQCLRDVCTNQKEACGGGILCEAKSYICEFKVELKKIEIEYGRIIMMLVIVVIVIIVLMLIKGLLPWS